VRHKSKRSIACTFSRKPVAAITRTTAQGDSVSCVFLEQLIETRIAAERIPQRIVPKTLDRNRAARRNFQ
jgi:hypothetical protein